MMYQKLLKTVKTFGSQSQQALVIGDLMLDRYLIGSVGRISPEAPVPVVLLKEQNERAGGAANVAANLALLGIKTQLIGCVGQDEEGLRLRKSMAMMQIDTASIITTSERPTIAKTRILGGHQQMLRLDQESTHAFTDQETQLVLDTIASALKAKPSIVILSDYAKGLLSETVCQQLIANCQQQNIPVLVDPKGQDYNKYKGATALTPNKKETAEACLTTIDAPDLIEQSILLKNTLDIDFLAVTRGEEGITLIESQAQNIAASAKKVFDVSGAGDTVIATLAAGLIHALSPLESLHLANLAAGVVVGEVGTVPINKNALVHALSQQLGSTQINKVCDLSALVEKVETWKESAQKIVFTNGCFDLLHAGHVTYLEAAKMRGDKLILGLNTDRSVSAIKGPTRPVVNEHDRARVLAALESVDAVILFDEDTPLALIKQLRPDIIAKGSDYTAEQVVGGKEVESWGGEIALIDLVEGRSTSNIIKKLNN